MATEPKNEPTEFERFTEFLRLSLELIDRRANLPLVKFSDLSKENDGAVDGYVTTMTTVSVFRDLLSAIESGEWETLHRMLLESGKRDEEEGADG